MAFVGAYFGEGTGPVFLDNLGCSGLEKHLDSCTSSGLFSTSCRHSKDVGVACLSKFIDMFFTSTCTYENCLLFKNSKT